MTDRRQVIDTLRAAGCVFAEDEADLLIAAARAEQPRAEQALAELVRQRAGGRPLEYLLGWVEFYGLRIAVTDTVFVPRTRTELLVRTAAELTAPEATVLDLCCGCGALGAALLSVRPGIELHAADVAPAAVDCAARNLGTRGTVYLGDFDAPLPAALRGRVDVLLANVPYVPTGQIALLPPEAREHEARAALDGGADGLDLLRRLAAVAPGWLRAGGSVLVECGPAQCDAAIAEFQRQGLRPRIERDEDFTVLVGTR